MTSVVYFLRCGAFVKVGFLSDFNVRFGSIRTSSPYDVSLIAKLPGTIEQERAVHKLLWRSHHRGEWFHYGKEIDNLIKEGLPNVDCTPKINNPLIAKAIELAGGTQAGLAEKLGLSQQFISKLLGNTKSVSFQSAAAISRATGGAILISDLLPAEARALAEEIVRLNGTSEVAA